MSHNALLAIYHHSSHLAQSKKNSIINNEKLAEWATEYKLHERIQAARAQEALIRNNTDVRASVFKAYVGAYWKQVILDAERYDATTGRLPGPYPNPVTEIHAWLDPLIEHEIIRIQEEDDLLADRMRRATLSPSGSTPSTPRAQRAGSRATPPMPMSPPPRGGALALLNERASQQRPPRALTWHERDEGDPHSKIFTAELEGEFPCKSPTGSEVSLHCPYRVVDGEIIAKGVDTSKRAAKAIAASQAIVTLGWVSILIVNLVLYAWT